MSNSPPPPGTPSPPLVQLICAACGIKFASMDNLVAHQAFYCPKRPEPQEHHTRCSKCKVSCDEQGTRGENFLGMPPAGFTFVRKSRKYPRDIWTPLEPPSKRARVLRERHGARPPPSPAFSFVKTGGIPYRYIPSGSSPGEGDLTRRNGLLQAIIEPGSSHTCASGATGGWRCPVCGAVSPTAGAAQRHMDAHQGVKAFRCTICRYKGNTLRGMRTHIRMHFEKRGTDLQVRRWSSSIFQMVAIVLLPLDSAFVWKNFPLFRSSLIIDLQIDRDTK